jgi:probable rRNA maturation factor
MKGSDLPTSGLGKKGTLEIFVADEQAGVAPLAVDLDRWEVLTRAVLDAEGVTAMGADVEMSLLFVDEAAIATLNEKFMGRPGPTDVLSFPIDDHIVRPGRMPDNGPRGPGDERDELGDDSIDDDDVPVMLGDVVICPVVAARNAAEHRGPNHDGSLDDELGLLVVHGILHVLGLDHADDDEAELMEARERELLHRFHRRIPLDSPDSPDSPDSFESAEPATSGGPAETSAL